jgi:hypothetical protein
MLQRWQSVLSVQISVRKTETGISLLLNTHALNKLRMSALWLVTCHLLYLIPQSVIITTHWQLVLVITIFMWPQRMSSFVIDIPACHQKMNPFHWRNELRTFALSGIWLQHGNSPHRSLLHVMSYPNCKRSSSKIPFARMYTQYVKFWGLMPVKCNP